MRVLLLIIVATLACLTVGQAPVKAGDLTYMVPTGWVVKNNNFNYPLLFKGTKQVAKAGIFSTSTPTKSFDFVITSHIRDMGFNPRRVQIVGPEEALGPYGKIVTITQFEGNKQGDNVTYTGESRVFVNLGERYTRLEFSWTSIEAFEEFKDSMLTLAKSIKRIDATSSSTSPETKWPLTREAIRAAPEVLPRPTFPYSENIANCVRELGQHLTDGRGGKLPDLMLAAEECGFFVLDSTGTVIRKPYRGAGIGVQLTALELINYARLQESGAKVKARSHFNAISEVLGQSGPKLDVERMAVQMIQAGLKSNNDSFFFFSHLMVDLGKRQTPSYDLSTGGFPEGATLDATQTLMITRFLLTQMIVVPTLKKKQNAFLFTGIFASINPPEWLQAQDTGIAQFNKEPSWTQDAIIDVITMNAGSGVEQINQYFEKAHFEGLKGTSAPEKFASKYAAFLARMNLAMSCIKFYALYASIEAAFDTDELYRTKSNKQDGKTARVNVQFQSNPLTVAQALKDIRLVIAPFGLDVDMPAAGPMAGSTVEWSLPDTNSRTFSDRIVAISGTDFRKRVADAEGKDSITLTGLKQKVDLESSPVHGILKYVTVRATPTIKGANLKQDAVDGVNTAAGYTVTAAGGGNPLYGAATFAMEMFYREPLLAPKSTQVVVHDWTQPSLKFNCQISVTGEKKVDQIVPGGYKHNSIQVRRYVNYDEMLLFPSGAEHSAYSLGAMVDRLPDGENPDFDCFQNSGTKVGYTVDDFEKLEEKGSGGCRVDNNKKSPVYKTEHIYKGVFGYGSATVRLVINWATGKYYISLPESGIAGSSVLVKHSGYSSVDGKVTPFTSREFKWGLFEDLIGKPKGARGEEFGVIEGDLPPKNPDGKSYGVIEGSCAYGAMVKWCPVVLKYHWRIESLGP